MTGRLSLADLENLDLATGASGAQDLANLLPKQVARDINRYVIENSFARTVFTENEDLVGAQGLTINYPLKEKTIAHKLSDMGDVLIGQGEFSEVPSETFVVGARAQWSYAAEEARLFDLMGEELFDAINAVIEFENTLVLDVANDGVDGDNSFSAATAGTFAYADLVEMRKLVKGPMDYVVLHPDEMADVLSDDKFLRTDFITNIDRIAPSTTVFNTALGITIYETEQATAGRVLGFNSRRGGRFTVKTRPRTQRFDLGEGGGALQKGVTVWELIDAVVTRGDSIAKCTV